MTQYAVFEIDEDLEPIAYVSGVRPVYQWIDQLYGQEFINDEEVDYDSGVWLG